MASEKINTVPSNIQFIFKGTLMVPKMAFIVGLLESGPLAPVATVSLKTNI